MSLYFESANKPHRHIEVVPKLPLNKVCVVDRIDTKLRYCRTRCWEMQISRCAERKVRTRNCDTVD